MEKQIDNEISFKSGIQKWVGGLVDCFKYKFVVIETNITYFSIFLNFGVFHRICFGQKSLYKRWQKNTKPMSFM